jgi:hypothetical protein
LRRECDASASLSSFAASELKRPVSILDVAGTPEFWQLMGLSLLDDVRITILNLEVHPVSAPLFESVAADARDLGRYAETASGSVSQGRIYEEKLLGITKSFVAFDVGRDRAADYQPRWAMKSATL